MKNRRLRAQSREFMHILHFVSEKGVVFSMTTHKLRGQSFEAKTIYGWIDREYRPYTMMRDLWAASDIKVSQALEIGRY